MHFNQLKALKNPVFKKILHWLISLISYFLGNCYLISGFQVNSCMEFTFPKCLLNSHRVSLYFLYFGKLCMELMKESMRESSYIAEKSFSLQKPRSSILVEMSSVCRVSEWLWTIHISLNIRFSPAELRLPIKWEDLCRELAVGGGLYAYFFLPVSSPKLMEAATCHVEDTSFQQPHMGLFCSWRANMFKPSFLRAHMDIRVWQSYFCAFKREENKEQHPRVDTKQPPWDSGLEVGGGGCVNDQAKKSTWNHFSMV